MITAIPFVPRDDPDEAANVLAIVLSPELQPILDWFGDNYMGRQNRRGHGRRICGQCTRKF